MASLQDAEFVGARDRGSPLRCDTPATFCDRFAIEFRPWPDCQKIAGQLQALVSRVRGAGLTLAKGKERGRLENLYPSNKAYSAAGGAGSAAYASGFAGCLLASSWLLSWRVAGLAGSAAGRSAAWPAGFADGGL